jgi:hypothetical protein
MNGYRLLMLLLGLGMGLFSQSVLADPPGRVGRISYLSGQVEFSASPYDLSNPAHINWPVTLDNIIQTQRFGRAEVRIGSTALRLDDETEIRFEQLDDQFVRVRMERGHVYVNLRNAENAREFELSTPQGRLTLFGPATFRIDFSTRPDSTTIHLFSGRGQFDNKGVIWPLETGKQFSLLHDESITQNLYMNEFDRWSMARDRAEEKSTSTRYVSAETTGYEELDRHGVWRESEEYGSVWYPRSVPEGWAPYRHGRWTWLQPWGWTWVDDAPWGYAPSHYGRWVWLGGRWCWSPGRRATRPVWAPAVVGWVVQQKSGNTVVSGNPNIGWFPLSPGTTYKPVYAVSSNYLDQLNSGHTHRRHGPEVTYPHHTGITTIDSSHFNSNKIVIVKQGVIQMVDSKTAPNQLRQYDNGRSGQPLAPPAPVGHELRPAGQVHTAPSQGNLPNGAVTVLPRRNTVVEPPRPIHRPSSPVAPAVQPIPQPVQPRSTFVEQPPIPQPVQPRSTFVEQPSTAQPLQPRPPVVQQPPIGQPIPQPIAQPRQPRPTFVEQPPMAQPVQPRPVVVHQPPVAQPYQPRPAVVEQPIPQPIQPRQPMVQPPPVIHTPPQAPPQPRPTVAQPAPAQAVPIVPRPIEPRPASAKADEGVPRGNIRHPGKERDEKLDKMK